MKIEMKIRYSMQMKTMQVNIPLQNLPLQHKTHHNLGHQQLTSLLELQPDPIFPPSPEEDITQNRTQKLNNTRDISVNVLSPIKINNTKNKTRFTFDPPSILSAFKHSIRRDQSETTHNNNQQTSSQLYDPFNYFFFPPPNTNTQTNTSRNVSQNNINNINPITTSIRTYIKYK